MFNLVSAMASLIGAVISFLVYRKYGSKVAFMLLVINVFFAIVNGTIGLLSFWK